jgi:hypothetical protein
LERPREAKHIDLQELKEKFENSKNLQQLAARANSELDSISLRQRKQLSIHNGAGSGWHKRMQLRQIGYNASQHLQ